MDINLLADEARKSLSGYCMEECNAYCCRKGFLVLSIKEIKLVFGDKFMDESLIKTENEKFSLKFNINGCPSLHEGKCKIHKDKKRPQVCKDFPIFIEGNTIRISKGCYGVSSGKLYFYISQFKKLGYNVE